MPYARFADEVSCKTHERFVKQGVPFQRQLESGDYVYICVGTTSHCDAITLNSSLAIFSLSRSRQWPRRPGIDHLRQMVSQLHIFDQMARAEQ
jgi:hypothetical protein